ncbi:MAG: AAA family ATPase [Phycisphaerae bacterium]|jgi:ABC-type multidrug transport system ATPase subunit
MRIDKVYIEDFKNLKKFSIDLDKGKMKTVLLGQNATGKSNFIEALVLIFKYLDLSTDTKRQYPNFDYSITYEINKKPINIIHTKNTYEISIGKEKIKNFKSFFSQDGKRLYQPKYVFTYYSGLSNKLKKHFWEHQEKFYDQIIKPDFKENELDSLRKLFYVQMVHSYFVLLAYFSFADEEKESIKFLNEVLKIKDIESILFILKMPGWAKNRIKKDPDDRFWTAEGLVRRLLDLLWTYSLAPIYHHEKIKVDFKEEEPQDRLYLYISTKEKLKALAKNYKSNTGFFKALESTYISKMMEEVRIKVKKESVEEGITFKELSEGEQQLLTVLGLLKFTKDEESLILLDEPDTHLNPIWKWKYFEYLDRVVKKHETTQIIINTHDPLVIGSLTKEEVRVFRNDDGKVIAEQPDIDPRGLGVEGILTSDLFGLPTVLDDNTLSKLEKRNSLLVKQQEGKLTGKDKEELSQIYQELDELGFSQTFRDPLYQKFIIAFRKKTKGLNLNKYSKEDIAAQNKIAFEVLKEIEEEEKL